MGVRIRNGKFYFNGEKQDMVWGRSSFKLSNQITYHYTGQGGGKWGLGSARRWIEHNQRIFGEHVVLRVFLETAGWDAGIDRTPDGVPQGGMFGSEPSDQGFWQVARLRDGVREKEVHPVGRKTIEEFYKLSEQTGVAFELVIIATLKHDNVPRGEMDHVIRQVGVLMGELNQKYPKALIIPSTANEWNAHSQIPLSDVNMWAARWYRDNYWPDVPNNEIPLIVDGGGNDRFQYKVEEGFYHAGMVHPDRGDDWWRLPDIGWLRRNSNGYPIGFTESMYYVEEEDVPRAEQWYRNRRGWNHNWRRFEMFYEDWPGNIDYGIIHDEKGAQSDPNWPRPETRMEAWAKSMFNGVGGGTPDPIPTPPPPPEPEPQPDGHPVLHAVSAPTENGVRAVTINFPSWPRLVPGVKPGDAVLEEYEVELPQSFTFYAGGSFIGLDAGDKGEYDVRMFVNGVSIYNRSLHRHNAEDFDSEHFHYTAWQRGSKVKIQLGARTTGANDVLRPGQEWASRPDFVARLWTYPEFIIPDDNPPPPVPEPPDPEPEPEPDRRPTDYIPWKDRREWAFRVLDAYSVWRGHWDLHYLYDNLDFVVKEGHLKDLSSRNLKMLIDTMDEAHKRQERLSHRIVTERHRKFSDRSQVRKSVANDMIAELKMLTREYEQISAGVPHQPGCDSIRCRIKKMKGE